MSQQRPPRADGCVGCLFVALVVVMGTVIFVAMLVYDNWVSKSTGPCGQSVLAGRESNPRTSANARLFLAPSDAHQPIGRRQSV
jgi:hypothetical protein